MNGDRNKKLAKLTAVWLFALFISAVLCYQILLPLISSVNLVNAAESGGDKRKPYKNFSHSVAAHERQTCAACHKSPNGFSTAAKTLNDDGYRFPDIADYPPHASCVNCHRQQFFSGARPQICTVCHTQSSPRASGRFAFPQPSEPSEFSINFPHNVHQDIIAQNQNSPKNRNVAVAHFAVVKFDGRTPDDEKKTNYNNCTICHQPTTAKTFLTAPRQPVETVLENEMVAARTRETFAASVGHFKTAPTNHESCFSCHFSEQQPTRIDCAGCHLPSKTAPKNFLTRTSLKFNHDQKTEAGTFPHERECASCHVQITQSADLRLLNPDVPIFTCASKGTGCHSDEIRSEVDRRIGELLKKQANAQLPVQTCSYCHNAYIGSFQVPESHQSIKP